MAIMSFRTRQWARAGAAAIVVSAVFGCSNLLHQSALQQGNIVSDQMIARLKPGMTPEQVRFVMGEPVLHNPFNPNRWDYVYTFESRGRITQRRMVSLFFEDGGLKYTLGHLSPVTEEEASQSDSESGDS